MNKSEELFESLGRQLLGFIRSRVGSDSIAEDILQDVFLKIHSKAETLQDQSSVKSWVYTIARNAIIDHYRQRKQVDSLDLSHNEIADQNEEPSAPELLGESMRRMVDELPDMYREALILTEYQGLSQQDLAKRLAISLSGAKSRVQRARRMLKDKLLECCHFELDRYGTIIDYQPISCACCSQGASCSPENPC